MPLLPRTVDTILSDLQLPIRTFPISFAQSSNITSGVRVGLRTSKPQSVPDVTAVILNWSRLDNVIRIASLLCGPWLDDTIAQVYVWNNSPQQLSREMFDALLCDTQKLKIENSSENLYFYARFLACTKVSTPYCFVQDDDYIVLPELIKTLRARMEESSQSGIYLLPPHEHLSSRLRTTITSNGIHTGFAWLGYGAMINQQQALKFFSLLHDDSLGVSKEQIKMADNYFTILSNEIPEIWFDHGIELRGGHPFTVGLEGIERNQLHMDNACRYLDEIVARPLHVAVASANAQTTRLDFVKRDNHVSDPARCYINRVAALGTPCLLESNIRLLPEDSISSCIAAIDLLTNEERRARLIGQDAILHYQRHPLSYAVDGDTGTVFHSPYDAKQGDYILMDTLSALDFNTSIVELVFLVAASNERILHESKFECSSDGKHWLLSPYPSSTTAIVKLTWDSDELLEYSVRMAGNCARFFRATVSGDVSVPWMVHEVWVRAISQSG